MDDELIADLIASIEAACTDGGGACLAFLGAQVPSRPMSRRASAPRGFMWAVLLTIGIKTEAFWRNLS